MENCVTKTFGDNHQLGRSDENSRKKQLNGKKETKSTKNVIKAKENTKVISLADRQTAIQRCVWIGFNCNSA